MPTRRPRLKTPLIRLIVVHNPHTTEADAALAVKDIQRERPDVLAPFLRGLYWRPAREKERKIAGGELDAPRFQKGVLAALEPELRQRIHILDYARSKPRSLAEVAAFDEASKQKQQALKFFLEGRVDEARQLISNSIDGTVKANQAGVGFIRSNISDIRKLVKKYPELMSRPEIRVLYLTSTRYTFPFLGLSHGAQSALKNKQNILLERRFSQLPYTFSTYNQAIRERLISRHVKGRVTEVVQRKKLSQDVLDRVLVEETLEDMLRKDMPDSAERFKHCRELANRLLSETGGNIRQVLEGIREVKSTMPKPETPQQPPKGVKKKPV